MTPVPDNPLTAQIEAGFRQFLATSYGLHIHAHQTERLTQAIYKTSQKFGWANSEQLLAKLISDLRCPEHLSLIEQITVDESYFFRDETQQNFLKNVFFPALIAQKRLQQDRHIRVWSAGCSTGQEIYSIAILLHQLLVDFPNWQLDLIGSDINQKSLKNALKAQYNSWEIRSNESFISQSGYFTALGNGYYQLNETIRKQVKFFCLNLAEDTFPSLMNQTCDLDLILCRNVFIYFQPDIIEQACSKFSQALKPGGMLMLSATDPMNLSIPHLIAKQAGDVFYFERAKDDSNFDYSPPTVISNVEAFLPVNQNLPTLDKQAEDFAETKAQIQFLLATQQWQEAITLTEQVLSTQPDNPELQQFKAKALVNLGRTAEAKRVCEKILKLNSLDPHSYLLYGLILLQLNLHDEAEMAFRQSIFLDHDCMEAHYQLGQVLLAKNQQKPAIKAIKNALRLAEQGDAQKPVDNVIVLTYARFAANLKNELSLLQHKEQNK